MVECMQEGPTIASEVYFVRNTKNKTMEGNTEQRAWNADIVVVLLHDNARPDTAPRTRAMLELLTTLLTAMFSPRATTISLPI
jgi:hypothetical protein